MKRNERAEEEMRRAFLLARAAAACIKNGDMAQALARLLDAAGAVAPYCHPDSPGLSYHTGAGFRLDQTKALPACDGCTARHAENEVCDVQVQEVA